MRPERDYRIRQQAEPKVEHLSYPYSYVQEYVPMMNRMPGEPVEDEIDFSNCVTHYYWIYKGEKDEMPWRALFTYKDEKSQQTRYGYYRAHSNYTGFDCCGMMQLYVSDHYNVLIEKGMTEEDYCLYMKDTEPSQ
jgi:hypothetical protein